MNKTIDLTDLLGIEYPIIVAPMFLISNVKMVKAALDAGVTAAIPALNYRDESDLRKAIKDIKAYTTKPFGINLIVNKSNPLYKNQLKTLLELKVDFIITSLGSPEETIKACKPLGIKVFCDVVDLKNALKVEKLGADAIIAVNSQAGGHAGNLEPDFLINLLKKECKIPIISAGGISNGMQLKHVMELGAAGASIGTIFIASNESDVSQEYKQALINYGAKDIVKTTKMSGSPLTVINTPYVKTIGTKANLLERLVNSNKWLKKYLKMFIMFKGMQTIEKAAFSATYKTVWCAGPSIESIHSIRPIKEIINQMTEEYVQAA